MYIDAGGIAEMGSHEELISQKGEYYKLYMSQYDFLKQDLSCFDSLLANAVFNLEIKKH